MELQNGFVSGVILILCIIYIAYHFKLITPTWIIRKLTRKKSNISIAYNYNNKTTAIYCNDVFVGMFDEKNQLIQIDNCKSVEEFIRLLSIEMEVNLETVNPPTMG